MSTDGPDHILVAGSKIAADPEEAAATLTEALEQIAAHHEQIADDTGAPPEPSAWVRSRQMQRTYQRELQALKARRVPKAERKAAAIAEATTNDNLRQRAQARTHKLGDYLEHAQDCAREAEERLEDLDNVSAALEALTRARQALEHALHIIDINQQALASLGKR